MSQNDCPLCRRDAAEDVIWHNDRVRIILVAHDLHPGYTRVIWADHVAEMTQLQASARNEIMNAVWLVEAMQRKVLRPHEVNLAEFGNMVPHVHWHVIPRWEADPLFPEAIWASAPGRTPQAIQAWHEEKSRIDALLPVYREALHGALAAIR